MKLSVTKKESHESGYQVEALARGLAILELFTRDTRSLSLSDIVASLGMNKSTAFRFLSTLERMGYLEKEPSTRRYRPSLKVLQLGFRALDLEVRQVARPYLEQLAQEVGETVSMGIMNGIDVIYIDRVRNRAIVGIVLDIGSHLPAHCTTIGKVLLSELTHDALDVFFEKTRLEKLGPQTITTREAFLAELAVVRGQGYAICDEEVAAGLRAAGAPIRDYTGKPIAAVNVSGSVSTITQERLLTELVPSVMRAARKISSALGCPFRGQEQG